MGTLEHEELSKKIIAAAYNVHKELGHGFLEKVQLVNYLKATGINVGLLINFAESVEIKRRIYGFDGSE